MSRSRRHRSLDEEADYVTPSEFGLVLQAVAIVVFSSWALGGGTPWAQETIFVLALLGLPLLVLRQRERERREMRWRSLLPALFWLIFVGVAVLNPSHELASSGSWLPRAAWLRWLPTTADPDRTFVDGRMWLAALLTGGAAWALLRHERPAAMLWRLVAVNGFILAVVGAWYRFAGADQVLGFIEAPEPSYFFATFFYKNHWAAFGALAGTASLTLSLRAWPAALAGHPTARGETLFFAGAGLLTLVTLPLPGSRAGAVLAVMLVVAFGLLMLRGWWRFTGKSRRRRIWPLVAGGAIMAGILTFGWMAYAPRASIDLARTEHQFANAAEGEALDIRLLVDRDTWTMTRQRPWFGWGPGCYEIVFPLFQGNYLRDTDGHAWARFRFAHDDWLQQLAEDGFVGAALLFIPGALAAAGAWRRAGPAGRAGLAGCGLISVYAWIDFPFHNPAVLILWTVLLTTAGRLDPAARPPKPTGND